MTSILIFKVKDNGKGPTSWLLILFVCQNFQKKLSFSFMTSILIFKVKDNGKGPTSWLLILFVRSGSIICNKQMWNNKWKYRECWWSKWRPLSNKHLFSIYNPPPPPTLLTMPISALTHTLPNLPHGEYLAHPYYGHIDRAVPASVTVLTIPRSWWGVPVYCWNWHCLRPSLTLPV